MLSELIPEAKLPADVEIGGLALDSRQVKPGDLFFACPGTTHDGRDFIDDAVARQAGAIVAESPLSRPPATGIPCVEMTGVASKVGAIASRYFDHPSGHMVVIAVTGTNGKTSCAHFIAQALTTLGRKCGVIGTLGAGFPGALSNAGLTTPDAITIQRTLAELLRDGAGAVSLEASSHGLAQQRLAGTQIDVGVFTNITRDHLDYHDSFDDYRHAKRLLFDWPGLKAAVLNVDDEFGAELACTLEGVRVLTCSRTQTSADIHCRGIDYRPDHSVVELVTPWGEERITTTLLGDFNLDNILAVTGVLGFMEFPLGDIVAAVTKLETIPGRMDLFAGSGHPTVVIDYAHTPDALEKVLAAVRRHCEGKLWCVFGCGGDRDRGKRPLMGSVAESLADRLVLTDDNPRNESSDAIIAEILEGIDNREGVIVEADRKKAIAMALASAGPDDMVLLAGKGHEDYQEVAGERIDYSDYREVENFLTGNRH